MKFRINWSIQQDKWLSVYKRWSSMSPQERANEFPAGGKLLGRWHDMAGRTGVLIRGHEFGVSMPSRNLRRNFLAGLLFGLRVVWPILSVLLGLIIALGLVVGLLEGWSVQDSIYFAFVSGLTIGYGDLAPTSLLTRALAILIGVCGVLMTALLAAIAVKALTAATDPGER